MWDRLRSKMAGLPAWAVPRRRHVEIVAAAAYPTVLARLGVAEISQYWLEVARRIALQEVKTAMAGRVSRIRIKRDPMWSLGRFPEGAGAEAGAAEFRRHYARLKRAAFDR